MKKNKSRNADASTALNTYFEQIGRTPLLTFEDECRLSKRVQKNDDPEARRMLVEANLRLVVKIARAFVTADVGLADLIQEGNLGLMHAAGRFDHRKQVRFSTYAAWWIRQSIMRALANKRRLIRLPHRKEDALKHIQTAFTVLTQRLMRRPSIAEVADYLHMDSKEVGAVLAVSGGTVSMDHDLGGEAGTWHDIVEDYTYSPDAAVMQRIMHQQTMAVLDRLLAKERQVLLYRFAFYGGRKYTLKSISDEMGISPETVRQIELRALQKLREQAPELAEYVTA